MLKFVVYYQDYSGKSSKMLIGVRSISLGRPGESAKPIEDQVKDKILLGGIPEIKLVDYISYAGSCLDCPPGDPQYIL